MDNVRKRHANRPIVLTKEDGQLQDGIRHVFAYISGGLGEPGDLRDDSAPREVGPVVQNHYQIPPRRHRVGGDGDVIDRVYVKRCRPSRCGEAHL